MNTPEAQDITGENESSENNPGNDNDTGRKRKRQGAGPSTPFCCAEQAYYSLDSDSSTDSEASDEERVIQTNQAIRCTVDCFEEALDNLVNYYIEIKHADEERVFMIRQTMTRIYEIIRFSSNIEDALAFANWRAPV